MRWLLVIVLLLPGICQAQEGLTETDKREILVRLSELRLARKELDLNRQHISRDEEQDRKEAELHAKEIELSKQRETLTAQERDVAREQADHYKRAYEEVSKSGRGLGCVLKKVFTFGIARCK